MKKPWEVFADEAQDRAVEGTSREGRTKRRQGPALLPRRRRRQWCSDARRWPCGGRSTPQRRCRKRADLPLSAEEFDDVPTFFGCSFRYLSLRPWKPLDSYRSANSPKVTASPGGAGAFAPLDDGSTPSAILVMMLRARTFAASSRSRLLSPRSLTLTLSERAICLPLTRRSTNKSPPCVSSVARTTMPAYLGSLIPTVCRSRRHMEGIGRSAAGCTRQLRRGRARIWPVWQDCAFPPGGLRRRAEMTAGRHEA
jgi:hypothetical protein